MAFGILGALAMLGLLHVLLVLLQRQFAALGPRFWATGRALAGGIVSAVALALLVPWLPSPPGLFLGLALAGIPGGLAMAVAATRRRRRLPARDGALPRGAHGLDGLLALVAVVFGILLHRTGMVWPGGAVVVAGTTAALRLMWREVRVGDQIFNQIQEGLEDAEHWPLPIPEVEVEGYDPWEDDRVRGRWRGLPVRVAMLHDGALIEADLEGWPPGLRLVPQGDGAVLGDAAFDQRWTIEGPVLAARLTLRPEARLGLLALAADTRELEMLGGTLHVRLDGEHLEAMPALLDRIVDLATTLGEVPPERFRQLEQLLETAEQEPEPHVRRGHYRLLLDDEHQRRRVLLAAAEDPEAEVRALAEEEATELSAYR